MRTYAAAAVLAAVAGLGLPTLAPAGAQPGYPAGSCTTTSGSQSQGSFAVGQSFSFRITPTCAFTGGALVTMFVNGQPVGTKEAGPDGAAIIDITIASPTLLIINDPVEVPARCGTNTVVATGPSTAAGGPVTQTATFNVDCPGAAPAAAGRAGRVAFTGAFVAEVAAAALLLVVLGATLWVATRRRRSAV